MTGILKHFATDPRGTRVTCVAVYIDLASAVRSLRELLADSKPEELPTAMVVEIEALGTLAREMAEKKSAELAK
jgi:hypothetical protein